ncbi:MAG: Asp-tRNA(Asn)/Glu-tRNA(Gln) amidotransferase subunit GatB [Patescibacteria group bacterium]|nr:MAG: Asp-tRNA(Asn)/Glu-tRNA(Gln) amidotransferase subunit GatB [Patescibacteria group bacterium]
MSEYTPTIGLEIHAELKTRTKMFCNSKNDPEEKRPNVNICPVCMAHPGTLPVINKAAVKHVLKVGKALGGQLADFTEFDRKNYFYPDIPKGYQISQYKYPLVSGGNLAGVDITRVHLEEDTARSSHDKGDYSLVDFNRAGVPLMELVTEPVIGDAETAIRFAKEFQILMRYLGASDANMEKGEMRVEANISVSKTDEYGTKVEVKNLNSFKVAHRAIIYEIKRQIKEIESGGEVVQETRGWDEAKGATFSQRAKESSHDYRYFPDPDLPKLHVSEIKEFSDDNLAKEIPELPWEKRERYKKEYGIKNEDIESYVTDRELGGFFEDVTSSFGGDRELIFLASNYITSDLAGLMKSDTERALLKASDFSELIKMAKQGDISSRGAKDILVIMYKEGGTPADIAEEKNLLQKSDEEELEKIVLDIITNNPNVVKDYRAGKEASLQFLIGQGMKATKGSANPQVLKKLFEEKLK